MLNKFLFKEIEEEDIGNIWFQQDGATCHTTEATLDVLRPVFEDRVISRRADVVWPPRSCNLTPLNYYLWANTKLNSDVDSARKSDLFGCSMNFILIFVSMFISKIGVFGVHETHTLKAIHPLRENDDGQWSHP